MALGVLYWLPRRPMKQTCTHRRGAPASGKGELADLGTLLARDGTWTVE